MVFFVCFFLKPGVENLSLISVYFCDDDSNWGMGDKFDVNKVENYN